MQAAYLVTVTGVYLAAGVFLLGMAYRLLQWRRTAASPMRLGIFPKPAAGARPLRIVADTVLFPQLAEVNPALWTGALVFHAALAGVFVGHLHLLGRFPGGLEALMSAGASTVGGTMGVLWALAIVFLLIRRFKSPVRELSTPEDYLLLLLLLGVVVMGDHLRFIAHIDVAEYQRYVGSLLAFRPEIPPAILASRHLHAFMIHIGLADLLLMYLPFSKLVHFVGAFFTSGIRRG